VKRSSSLQQGARVSTNSGYIGVCSSFLTDHSINELSNRLETRRLVSSAARHQLASRGMMQDVENDQKLPSPQLSQLFDRSWKKADAI
jgi:hypothetical protein